MKGIGKPTVLIVNGVNFLGGALSKTLLDQGAEVSMLGNFDDSAREFVKQFKESAFKFLDFSVVAELTERFSKLDYVVILLNDLAPGVYATSDFVKALKNISDVLDATAERNAKLLLVTSMRWDAVMRKGSQGETPGYTREEIDQFAEKTVNEYVSRSGLDARIVRLGEVYGKGMDVMKDSLMVYIIKEALKVEEVVVPGETLQFDYYIHVLDAVFGILKALFTKDTKGKLYLLANPQEISLLTLAHKVIEAGVTARRVRFESKEEEEPLYKNAYTVPPNVEALGWAPKISFERGLAQTVDYFREVLGRGKSKPGRGAEAESEEVTEALGDDLSVSVKMDEVIPVEMSKERERFERIQKLKTAREKREAGERFRKALTISGWVTFCALLLVFYFLLIVPAAGVVRGYLSLQEITSEYVTAYEQDNSSRLNELENEFDDTLKTLFLYSDRISLVWDLAGVNPQIDRISNLFYGTSEFMSGVARMNENETQADISFKSAKLWFDNSQCFSVNEGFCQPYEEVKALNSELLE